MSVLGRFTKQTAEILDYNVDYSQWFSNRVDSPANFVVVADPGITVVASSIVGTMVKVVLGGGTSGSKYKISIRLTTSSVPAVVKEIDFVVAVKDV